MQHSNTDINDSGVSGFARKQTGVSGDWWLKQTKDKPLFEDLLWSRPENKLHAGKLLVVGGNLHGFAAPGSAYGTALKAGIGTARVLLPDKLQKTVGKLIPEAEFGPSTLSGSFGKMALAQLLEAAQWADGVLLAGDFGRNSETAILLDSFMNKFEGQVTVAQDGLDYFWGPKSPLIERADTLSVINLGKLQKLAKNNRPATPVLHNMMLTDLVELLHDWTTGNPGQIITMHADNLIVASGGRVSTTPAIITAPQRSHLDGVQGADEQRTEPYTKYGEGAAQSATPQSAKRISGAAGSASRQAGAVRALGNWQIELAACASVWWLQNPQRPFEALSLAICDFVSN